MEKTELGSQVTENGVEENKKQDAGNGKERQLGGVRTMPFILANEACDRFASSGFHSNLITYLTQVLNMPLVKASNTISNFGGVSSFTPLIGAFIADSFAGRFWTIVVGSAIYVLGMVTITISAVLPKLRPPPCPTQENCQQASNEQLWVLYIALLLTSLGTGGIRPCVVTFAADQFDMSKAKAEMRGWNFFNWYFFCMEFATLLALTVLVYVQDNISWSWGLAIPTIAVAFSVVVFIVGAPLYEKVKPGGSPFVRVVQVVVATVRKRHIVPPANPCALYENKELDADISVNERLLHSNQFKWLDRAAVVSTSDIDELNQPNLWRLATVHRVEELKTIIRLLPIWAAAILQVASHSHLGSFTVQQARTMDRHLSQSFQIPPASMSIFTTLTVLTILPLYERLFVPVARLFTKNPAGITCLQRIGIGFGISILATIASALVEIKRKHVAADNDLLDKPTSVIPVSVFWLVPQYLLQGLAQIFTAVGHLEFLYDQAPESMRSTAVALYWIAIAMGSYTGTLVVSLVHKYTDNGQTNWLPDRNLNRGRLEYYYWVVTGIQVVNLVYFVTCAWLYVYKPIQEAELFESESGNVGNLLLGDKRVDQQLEMVKN